MGRRGYPYDNSKAESFMKTITVEEVYPKAYETAQPGPDGWQDAQRLDAKVGTLNSERRAPAWRDDVVQIRRKWHESAVVAPTDPELGKGVLLPAADRL
jgi:hypothetical protein